MLGMLLVSMEGYHELDIRASEEMQGHNVPGVKDVRVTDASPDGENKQPQSFHHKY